MPVNMGLKHFRRGGRVGLEAREPKKTVPSGKTARALSEYVKNLAPRDLLSP